MTQCNAARDMGKQSPQEAAARADDDAGHVGSAGKGTRTPMYRAPVARFRTMRRRVMGMASRRFLAGILQAAARIPMTAASMMVCIASRETGRRKPGSQLPGPKPDEIMAVWMPQKEMAAPARSTARAARSPLLAMAASATGG